MDLTWYGLSCFRLTDRGYASVVVDPYNGKEIGLPELKLRADVVTVSHHAPGHNHVDAVSGFQHVLDGPGEYEIGGVFITGISTPIREDELERNVLFLIEINGVTVAHLGDMARVPNQSEIEDLEMVNILLVPCGGGTSLNAGQAAELVSMIEPNIVVPMHYRSGDMSLALDEVDRFLKEMGVNGVEAEPNLRVASSNLPEETQVVLLTPKV